MHALLIFAHSRQPFVGGICGQPQEATLAAIDGGFALSGPFFFVQPNRSDSLMLVKW